MSPKVSLVMEEVDVPVVSARVIDFDHQEKRAIIAERRSQEKQAKNSDGGECDYQSC